MFMANGVHLYMQSYQINDDDFNLKSKLPPIGSLNINFDYILLNKKIKNVD